MGASSSQERGVGKCELRSRRQPSQGRCWLGSWGVVGGLDQGHRAVVRARSCGQAQAGVRALSRVGDGERFPSQKALLACWVQKRIDRFRRHCREKCCWGGVRLLMVMPVTMDARVDRSASSGASGGGKGFWGRRPCSPTMPNRGAKQPSQSAHLSFLLKGLINRA